MCLCCVVVCRPPTFAAQRVDYVEAALNRSGSLQQLPGSVDADMHEMEELQQRQVQERQQQQLQHQQSLQGCLPQGQQPGYGAAPPTSLGEWDTHACFTVCFTACRGWAAAALHLYNTKSGTQQHCG